MPLTGKFEFSRTLTGKVILRVEEERPRRWRLGSQSPSYLLWRNATMTDLMQPQLGDLLDLKNGTLPELRRPMRTLNGAPTRKEGPDERRLTRAETFDPPLEYREAAE